MQRFRGFVMGIVASGTFGLLPLFTLPLMGEGMSVQTILAYRILLAAFFMALYMFVRGESMRVHRRELAELAFLSLFYFVSAMLLFSGYKKMNSGLATVLHFSYPIFTTLIMASVFRQYISPVTLIAIVLSIGGVLLSTGALGAGIAADGWSVFIVILSGLVYAIYIVLVNNRPLLRDMNNRRLTLYAMFFSGLYCLIYALGTNTISLPASPYSWGNLMILSLVCTLISNITLVEALKSVGATLGSVLGAVEPMTAVAVGAIFLGERIARINIMGMGLIVVAVVLIVLSPIIDNRVKHRLARFEQNKEMRR